LKKQLDKPSGAEYKRRRSRAVAESRAEEKQRRANDAGADPTAAYKTIPRADLGDPTTALIYAQNCMLVALQEVVSDPVLPARERWKLIGFFGGQIGVTHAKALMQAKLAKVTKRLAVTKDVSGGPKPIAGIVRPATARGGDGGSRGTPADRSLLDPPKGEDE
jgi:hypothetical protein